MALSYSKRRCVCGGGGRGEKGGGGCRHFHVHYHFQRRRVNFFPFLRSPSCLLLPPVLFFSVLAFIVSFIWFTLFYFVVFLLSKDNNHEVFKNNGSVDGRVNVDKQDKEDEEQEEKEEEKAAKDISELTGDSAAVDIVDGFSDESEMTVRMAMSNTCVDPNLHGDDSKLAAEVIVVESSGEELNATADSDDVAESHELWEVPIEGFAKDINKREIITLDNPIPQLVGTDDEKLIEDANKLQPSSTSAEVHELVKKHEIECLLLEFSDANRQRMAASSNASFYHANCDGDDRDDKEFIEENKQEFSGTSSEVCDLTHKDETRGVAHDGCANVYKFREMASLHCLVHGGTRDEYEKPSEKCTSEVISEENEQEQSKKHVPELPRDFTDLEVFPEMQEIHEAAVDKFSDQSEMGLRMVMLDTHSDQQGHGKDDKLADEMIIALNNEDLPNISADVDDLAEKEAPIDGLIAKELNIRKIIPLGTSCPKVISSDDDKLPEELIEANKKEQSSTSVEVHNCAHQQETGGLSPSLDFVDENKQKMVVSSNASIHHVIGDEDENRVEEFIEENREEASGTLSKVCHLIDKHQTRGAQLDGCANEDRASEVTSLEGLVHDGIRDKDEKLSEKHTPKEAPLKLPIVGRHLTPWWSFCGVLEVFHGSKD